MSQSYVRIDHNFQGARDAIASYVLPGPEPTLIEAGPASTTDTLLAGIRASGIDPQSITRVLVTHIHLDHAGAAGTLMRRLSRARLFVHPKGAKHLIDPSKLIASAERLYGARMQELWGEILPVPEDRLVIVEDGETVGTLRAIDTPGHAVHHHAYYDTSTGTVFTGDIAGVRMDAATRYVRPPTPPPELDLDAWANSVERLRKLGPRRLALTHFGEYEDVSAHLDDLMTRLNAWRDWLSTGLSARNLEEHEAGLLSPELAARFERVGTYQMCVEGFARYFAKRAAA